MKTTSRMFLAQMAVATTILALSGGQPSLADDIEEALEREIVGKDLPLFEVQNFCDARVPPMPKIETVAQWQATAERLRGEVLQKIVYRGRAAQWRDATTRVEWLETCDGGPGYRIRKLRYEALPGMWIPALLYEPEQLSGKVPAILNVNGHSPEGKAYVPKQMRCINQAKRGMLALNVEWLGMGQLRTPGFSHASMNQLDLCGASGLAPFYLAMRRGLDLLLSLEHADPNRLAVTGLSGGGWQTIVISALDTRVKLAVPVAGYSSFLTRSQNLKDLGDSEQTPNDLATLVDYTHLTAMMAPRPTLLIYNYADNCCFESRYALGPLLNAAHPVFCLYGAADVFRSHVNYDPGTHNYEQNNREALYRTLGDVFFAGDDGFLATEIPSDDEVKTAEQLFIELPEKNEDFNTLARKLAVNLPVNAALPDARQEATAWQQTARSRLAEIVRAKDYELRAIEQETREGANLTTTFWQLQLGAEWTVPVAVLAPKTVTHTILLIADSGRSGVGKEIAKLIGDGARVVAIDPYGFGESNCDRGWLFSLLIAGVGDRPLGIQASQVAAATRWITKHYPEEPATLVAIGPRTGVVALTAAALEPDAIQRIELHNALGSLKQAIEENWSVRDKPELFCYGLLETLDIKQLAALSAPREIAFIAADERTKRELADLAAWYRTLGKEFDPLR